MPLFLSVKRVDFMALVTKRSSMALFSDGRSQYSHRVRIVLAEKGVVVEIINSDPLDVPEDVSELNPYGTLPVLVDRDLSLYDSWVMMEYLDERFPHPPLMPVQPVSRAYSRLWRHRIQRDWCTLVDTIENSVDDDEMEKARKELTESLVAVAPIFAEKPFFMSDELTLIDCCLAPILWRLPALGVELPTTKQVKPLLDYKDRMLGRKAFKESLSEDEKEMI